MPQNYLSLPGAGVFDAFQSAQANSQRNALMMEERRRAEEQRQAAQRQRQATGEIQSLMLAPEQETPGMDFGLAGQMFGLPEIQPQRNADRAREVAMRSRDPEVIAAYREAYGQMQTEQLAEVQREMGYLGSAALGMIRTPQAQRPAYAMQDQRIIRFLENAGVPREVYSNPEFWTDGRLEQFIDQAHDEYQITQELLGRTAPQTIGENESLLRTEGGQDTQTIGQAGIEARDLESRGLDIENRREDIRAGQLDLGRAELGERRRQFDIENDPERVSATRSADIAEDEDSLRREVNTAAGDASDLFRSYDVMFNSYNVDNAQGDLALLVAFTKALDPGSVAREGEVRLSQSSASVVQNAANWIRRLEEGNTRLPPEVRDGMIQWAQQQSQIDRASWERQLAGYEGLVQRRGYNPDNIFIRVPGDAVTPNTQGQPQSTSGEDINTRAGRYLTPTAGQ